MGVNMRVACYFSMCLFIATQLMLAPGHNKQHYDGAAARLQVGSMEGCQPLS